MTNASMIDDATVMSVIDGIIARESASSAPYLDVRIDAAIERDLAALLGLGVGSILERRFGDYVVLMGSSRLRALADDFRVMRALEIGAAPELVALRPFGEGHLLIARYWACPGERLQMVDETSEISAVAAERFQRDMRVLAEHDMLHPYVGRGYNAWLLAERSGTIALYAWHSRRQLSEHEREEALEGVDSLLARLPRRP
ncbi:Hypothetical protein A7982_00045 [Minicystis rosea]|nr:Hypothetical protein A7982_00045 [Minicystis rosea]